MKFYVIFAAAVLVAQSHSKNDSKLKEWEKFKISHAKQYTDQKDEDFRRELFLERLREIEEHNRKYEQGLVTFKMRTNKFLDRTVEEIVPIAQITEVQSKSVTPTSTFQPPEGFAAPENLDWRDEGVIPPVRDQGWCGSCWAFSTVGAIEPHLNIYLGINITLSEQNLVDCITELGCIPELDPGTWLTTAYGYVILNGIETEDIYPYQASEQQCAYDTSKIGAYIYKYIQIPSGDEEALKVAVASAGPVSVTISTQSWYFSAYDSGIYYDENCHNTADQLTHAVVVDGYGTIDGEDYWLVRNSWGESFGEDGYIKMARNRDNNCGIATAAGYPTVLLNP